jgi:hypothetical protein
LSREPGLVKKTLEHRVLWAPGPISRKELEHKEGIVGSIDEARPGSWIERWIVGIGVEEAQSVEGGHRQ